MEKIKVGIKYCTETDSYGVYEDSRGGTQVEITVSEFDHIQRVWEEFNKMQDWLYNKIQEEFSKREGKK
jgi:hypothetical protein